MFATGVDDPRLPDGFPKLVPHARNKANALFEFPAANVSHPPATRLNTPVAGDTLERSSWLYDAANNISWLRHNPTGLPASPKSQFFRGIAANARQHGDKIIQ